jgi:type IV pilus assembly protein PilN
MIKINLLPVRAAKKKETAVQQIIIFCAGAVLVLVVIVTMLIVEKMQIADTRNDIATANDKINELKKRIGKLEELKTLKDQVKKKLDVLTQLRKNKIGPARRLATLSDSTPDKLWLTSYGESGADIKISGFALNEDLIAAFMRNIESSSDYMGVELLVSEQKEMDGSKIKRFDLACKLQISNEPSTDEKSSAPQ